MVTRPARHSRDRPNQDASRYHEDAAGMKQPQSLERAQTRPLRRHLMLDTARQPLTLAIRGGERPDQPDIGDHVGQIADHDRSTCGEAIVQMATSRSLLPDHRANDQ